MKNLIFAMDTCFSNSIVGVYPYEMRCEILAELGYNGVYVSLSPSDLQNADKMKATKEKYGIDVVAAYSGFDVAAEDDSRLKQVAELFEQLPDGCDIEFSLDCKDESVPRSSPDGDERAIEKLGMLLNIAERHRANVCLYPHFGAWLERVEDGVRLCQKMEHPNLKAVFCGFHWYAADGKELAKRIEGAMPYLNSVNMCGSRRGGNIAGCTIEPLGNGEMDNFALLCLLRKNGYTGRIGMQGYSIGGDVYEHLRYSITVFRNMEERLERHPDWANLISG